MAAGVLLGGVAACSDDDSGGSAAAADVALFQGGQTTTTRQQPNLSNAGIAVSGKGEVEGRPDSLQIEVGVSARRDSVAQATNDAAVEAQAVIDALVGGGVAEEDIQTRSLSVYPEYDYPQNGQPRLRGYVFTNTVAATLRNLDDAGAVIDAALAAGGDDSVLNGVTFALEDDDEALVAAREAAFADARAKAEQLAELAGLELGPAVAIDETLSGGAPGPDFRDFAADGGAESYTAIAPGQVTTTVVVSIRFSVA